MTAQKKKRNPFEEAQGILKGAFGLGLPTYSVPLPWPDS
jgi:hypothetical protein